MLSTERFNGIRAFVSAAESGSFSEAARRLGLSTSSVGKAIGRLEKRLDVRLFHRTTRRLSLTDEGLAFHESCLRALAELEHAHTALTSRRLVPGGRLRIALPVLFGRDRVMPVLLALASQYPALEIDARFSHRAVDFADDGVDLAVRIGTLDNSDQLVARPLGVQRVVCCASPAYLAAHGTPHTPDDLRDHACLAAMRDGLTESWRWRDARGTAYAWSPHARLRFEHIEAVLAAALAGHGLAQLPGWLVDAHVARGALRTVLDEHAVEGLPIHAVWPASRSMTARLRVTIDALVASGCAR